MLLSFIWLQTPRTLVGVDGIRRDFGLLSANVEPAVSALGSHDALERAEQQKDTLELPPVNGAPDLI